MVDFNEGREERVRIHLRTGGGAFGGISVRDYFAANALMSMLSPVQHITDDTPAKAAELAYKFADAMLAERDKAVEDIRKEWSVEEAFGLGDSK